MDARLQVLESRSASASFPQVAVPGPSSRTPVADALPDDVTPHRTLGSAVPAVSSGVPFFPPAAAVSPQLRNQILAGNDINLVKILLCSAEASDRHFVDCGDVSVILRVTPSC